MFKNTPPLCGTTKRSSLEVIDLRTYTNSFFPFVSFICGNFYLGIVKCIAGNFLLISGFLHGQGSSPHSPVLQPPRSPCLPAMIDGPIFNLPSSFQRVKYFYFSFLDQCFFLVRKCSGRRFLDLSRAFPYNSFISDACLWCRNTYCHFNINIWNFEDQQYASS